MSEEIKLKPCPFCGSPAKIRINVVGTWFTIMCSASSNLCGVGPCTATYQDKATAIKEWNHRVIDREEETRRIFDGLVQRGTITREEAERAMEKA